MRLPLHEHLCRTASQMLRESKSSADPSGGNKPDKQTRIVSQHEHHLLNAQARVHSNIHANTNKA